MSKTTLLALAAFITSLANDSEGTPAATPTPDPAPGDPPKRGRPPGSKNEPKPKEEQAPAEETTKKFTREELMAVVSPLMKANPSRKAEVAALIKQHGGTCLSDIPAENQQAFVDDAEALQL